MKANYQNDKAVADEFLGRENVQTGEFPHQVSIFFVSNFRR